MHVAMFGEETTSRRMVRKDVFTCPGVAVLRALDFNSQVNAASVQARLTIAKLQIVSSPNNVEVAKGTL